MSTDAVIRELERALSATGSELSDEERRLLHAADPWPGPLVEIAAAIYAARLTDQSLREHARALREAATGANEYAAKLARATWALVETLTGILAVATIAGLFT